MGDTLKRLRYQRTATSNIVKRQIQHLLTGKAHVVGVDGLPSWWPFWSDVLVSNVRDAVRAGRALEVAENHAHVDAITGGPR